MCVLGQLRLYDLWPLQQPLCITCRTLFAPCVPSSQRTEPVPVHMHTHAHTRMQTHTHTRTYTHTHMRTHTRTHAHAHTQTHTHTTAQDMDITITPLPQKTAKASGPLLEHDNNAAPGAAKNKVAQAVINFQCELCLVLVQHRCVQKVRCSTGAYRKEGAAQVRTESKVQHQVAAQVCTESKVQLRCVQHRCVQKLRCSTKLQHRCVQKVSCSTGAYRK